MIYLQLFCVFLKIGIFSFGGGYAMLSLIQYEVVVCHQWISPAKFADIVALSQITPGPISINCATYIGYTATHSILGAALATAALVLPSVAVMLCICFFLTKFKRNIYVQYALSGIRLAVVGLIAAVALTLMNASNLQSCKSVLIFSVSIVILCKWKIHPLLLIALAGVAGIVLF